jgi:hypothetical protein
MEDNIEADLKLARWKGLDWVDQGTGVGCCEKI